MGDRRDSEDYDERYEDEFGEVLDAFPEIGRPSTHPWDVWCDGAPRTLERGKHFDALSCKGMRSTVLSHARKNDIRVRISLGRGGRDRAGRPAMVRPDKFITLQFFPGTPYRTRKTPAGRQPAPTSS